MGAAKEHYSAGDAFSAREALLGWMQDIAPYGIFTTDRELRIRSWNQWLKAHSGLAAEDVVGRSLLELFPELGERRLDEHFHRALRGEISVLSTALHRYLLPFPRPERDPGVPRMLQTARIAPLPAGELIVGTITIIEDVTQREVQALLLHRQQEHDRVLSSALGVLLQSADPLHEVAALFPKITLPLGLEAYFNYLYDEETRTLHLNAAGGILSKQKETLNRLRLGDGPCGRCAESRQPVLLPHLQQSTDPAVDTLRTFGFRTYCGFPLLVGDRLLGTLAFASSTRDTLAPDEVECVSTVAQYFAIAMDRARRENALSDAQRRLREHAGNLETKVTERTARLHETIAQLESFSYTVAHDLRAPIRALKGYCDILLADFTLPAGATDIVHRLRRASQRLDALTRDLLVFSKIARQPITLEPVDLGEVVQDLRVLTPALSEDGVLVVESTLPWVWGHRTMLQQCLSNLFDNALKFAAPDRPPRIVVRTEATDAESQSGAPALDAFNPSISRSPIPPVPASADSAVVARRVRVRIDDNGIGIPRQAHQKIFGIFERVSGHDHIEGTGIGLAIVARAMQQMGGACGVDSVVGEGSSFWLEFASVDGPPPAR